MAEWRRFAANQKAKRKGKKTNEESTIADEIIVQQMSPDVSGKQQKYTRIGAQQYVPFHHEEITIDNIKDACMKHFKEHIEKDLICDVLAGERGPSCEKMAHLQNRKVYYVRFIKSDVIEETESSACKPKRARYDTGEPSTTASLPSPKKQYGSQVSKVYPKSLSVVEMLKLGNVIAKNTTTLVEIFTFNIEHMEWSTVPVTVEFRIADKPFAAGGFREAFKATSETLGFSGVTWVVKKYLKSTLDDIDKTGQSAESHTRKAVQMHHLARNFASQLKEKVEKEKLAEFGTTFHYKKVFLGKMSDGGYVTIEEFIDGAFIKYINNNGDICTEDDVVCDKAQCFAHFTYEKSQGKLIVLDVQGAGFNLYDPEIASTELVDDQGSLRFCNGNLTEAAIKNFFSKHKCNFYCRILKLNLLPPQ